MIVGVIDCTEIDSWFPLPTVIPVSLTANEFNVPTEFKLENLIVLLRVAPVSVSAAAGTLIFAVPSNATPLIFLAVSKRVAVNALPESVAPIN